MGRKRVMWIVIGIILLAALLAFIYYENNALMVSHYGVNLNLRHSMKIVHISDLHGKQFGKNNQKLSAQIERIKPDLVVCTGDLIDDNGKNIEKSVYFMGELAKNRPVFFVSGNNEHQSGWYEKISKHLKQGGIHVLEDEIETIRISDNDVHILGFNEKTDPYDGYGKRSTDPATYEDFSALFDELSRKRGVRFVMTHYPENYSLIGEKSYGNFSFDMMFAGHAHGGQFVLPLIGPVFAPGQGLFPKFTDGIYGTKPKMCVSRGLGRSSFPIRLFNRPQIIDLTIL